ncbi:MAG: metallophosphoesterase family protein [Bacteroidales bacterium]|nr:metallophosphoesterase family protein [Bacteroidales bacterium]
MKKIGLLSDTHGSIPERAKTFFADCDEIWHAGDIGTDEVADKLEAMKPLRAVYGNIDGQPLRKDFPEYALFKTEDTLVLMMHIGGYPGRYSPKARVLIQQFQPGLFISGHSHILKVIYDKKNKLLHLNPGAAGNSGFHTKITMMRFNINKDRIEDLEILEIDRKREL